jgi:hypothetical protein
MKTEQTRIEGTSRRIVLAFLAGVLIWGTAIDEERFTVEVKLPVNLQIPVEYVVLGNFNDSVMINFTGSGWEMLRFQLGSSIPEIRADLRNTVLHSFPTNTTVELIISDIHPPGAISVSQVFPEQIQVSVDTLVSRILPVSVHTSDLIPERFRFVSVDPEFITVTGPASIVMGLDSISTESADISYGYTTVSLAFSGDMVAYSEQSVEVLVSDPVVPVVGFE